MKTFLLACLLALPTILSAGDFISKKEFQDYAEGHTLYFQSNGALIGMEYFGADQTTIWQDISGECTRGEWYYDAGRICFLYENEATPACWYIINKDNAYFAVSQNMVEPIFVDILKKTRLPLSCALPRIHI